MKHFLLALFSCLALSSALSAQTKYDLPPGSVVIETAQVAPRRTLILWMLYPEKYSHEEDFYSCPDQTRGNYYKGVTHLSLIDTKTFKTINSIEIAGDDPRNTRYVSIPYLIERFFYQVPVINSKKEGKPQIMALQDFNGDGKAQEFALFDREACQGVDTTLIGYDEKHDKVIQYPVELNNNGKTENVYWVDELFFKKPTSRGNCNYSIDYSGRGGTLDKYEVHYDKTHIKFVGSLRSVNTGS